MKRIINKYDIILIIVLIIVSVISLVLVGINKGKNSGDLVQISLNKKVIATLPLNVNTTYTIDESGVYNEIEINNKTVKIVDANCNDKICEKTGKISSDNDVIVCLPNKVVVQIIKSKSSYDAISR